MIVLLCINMIEGVFGTNGDALPQADIFYCNYSHIKTTPYYVYYVLWIHKGTMLLKCISIIIVFLNMLIVYKIICCF